jgi:aspartate/methionine/tyrosine aminotransferase
MHSFFARRTSWSLTTNRYTESLEAHRRAGRELLDLTASNPTTVGLQYREDTLLRALTDREALTYDPQPKGLLAAREAVAGYYVDCGNPISPNDLVLTTSTSEGYSFVFRLLCDPGDAVLVPTPSYPLFDFLADIQDVKLFPYELVYDHGWQMDFPSLLSAIDSAQVAGARCRAVLVVHPNNPTGSYVKPAEARELNRICASSGLAIVADEVFLDYSLCPERPLTFSANDDVLSFTLSGLSKISALPQMKVAWIAVSGPTSQKTDALARLEVIADTYLSMNAPIQHAIPTLLSERRGIQEQLMRRVRDNLAVLDSRLAQQKLCRRLVVEGGWYAALRVPVTGSDEDLAIRLLQEVGVLVQPGHFYDFANDGHLVISLITSQADFGEGTKRLLEVVGTIAS